MWAERGRISAQPGVGRRQGRSREEVVALWWGPNSSSTLLLSPVMTRTSSPVPSQPQVLCAVLQQAAAAPGALSCKAIPQSRAQRLTPHTRPLCFINNC